MSRDPIRGQDAVRVSSWWCLECFQHLANKPGDNIDRIPAHKLSGLDKCWRCGRLLEPGAA